MTFREALEKNREATKEMLRNNGVYVPMDTSNSQSEWQMVMGEIVNRLNEDKELLSRRKGKNKGEPYTIPALTAYWKRNGKTSVDVVKAFYSAEKSDNFAKTLFGKLK